MTEAEMKRVIDVLTLVDHGGCWSCYKDIIEKLVFEFEDMPELKIIRWAAEAWHDPKRKGSDSIDAIEARLRS